MKYALLIMSVSTIQIWAQSQAEVKSAGLIAETACHAITTRELEPRNRLKRFFQEHPAKVLKEIQVFLDSEEIMDVMIAVNILRYMRHDDIVPMLINLIESDRELEGMYCSTDYGVRTYDVINPRVDAINALGKFGDKRAIPTLKSMLDPPFESFNGDPAAYALYELTGETHTYRNNEGDLVKLELH